MQQQDNHEYPFLYQRQTCHQVQPNQATYQKRQKCQPATYLQEVSKKKGIKDECSRLLEASTMKSRRGFAIQRLMNAMRQAHADGWFIVFDTLTLADDRLEAFYDNPNALRDYFRDI